MNAVQTDFLPVKFSAERIIHGLLREVDPNTPLEGFPHE